MDMQTLYKELDIKWGVQIFSHEYVYVCICREGAMHKGQKTHATSGYKN